MTHHQCTSNRQHGNRAVRCFLRWHLDIIAHTQQPACSKFHHTSAVVSLHIGIPPAAPQEGHHLLRCQEGEVVVRASW
eukprot:1185317-Prorocentrum_minimum.AAC.2